MASFQQRGDAWRARVRRKGQPDLSATFDTKADAARWAAQVEADISRSRFVDNREAERTTLAQALTRYEEEYTASKKGAKQERGRINRWLKHKLAKKPLSAITSSDLADYRKERLAKVSGSTVRLDLAVLSNLFNVAAIEWRMEGLSNPCEKMKMPKPGRARDRRPTARELAHVIDAAANIHPDMPAIIELAVLTAMRRSELVMLTRNQIRGRVAYLDDTKNGDRRAVPLSKRALAIIEGLPEKAGGELFSLSPDRVTVYFREACRDAGVKDLRFHDLRHEATSRLFEANFQMMEVAAITGHKTLAMLQRYTHLSPEALAAKMG
jgi:integrase